MNESARQVSRRLGYTCSYVPEEIIRAAGLVPVRLLPDTDPSAADAHIHPNTCGYLRSLLAAGLRAEEAGRVGVVFAGCCDGMRKVHDLWQAYVPGSLALFLDLPKKRDALSTAFFASELRRFADRLNTPAGACGHLDEAGLEEAIGVCNRTRAAMTGLLARTGRGVGAVRASAADAACRDLLQDPGADPSESAGRRVSGVPTLRRGGTPVVVSGSLFRATDWISDVEALGGTVVALDTCLSNRHFEEPVEEGSGDPFLALARRYLGKPPCPRMDAFEDRCEALLGQARDSGARGVIYAPMQFCDPFQYDTLLLGRRLREAGVPLLVVETEYEASMPEQVRTRVGAFLETLAGQGPAEKVLQGGR